MAIVRAGYDAIADAYLTIRNQDSEDVRLLDELRDRLPDGARVLDVGCGAGVPITRLLSRHYQVTGVDLSATQIELARQIVPEADLIVADMRTLDFPDMSFDAIVSYYAIIHVPRRDHPAVLRNFRRMLKPGGLLLITMGAGDNPDDTDEDWLGAGASMYWSHHDRETNLRLIEDAGFSIIWEWLVAEPEEFGGGVHLFVLGSRSG